MGSLSNTVENDLVLFQKIKAGEAKAFKALFLQYYDKLHHFVILLCEDPILAEEVVQEVFTKIWEKRKEIEIKTSVKYYLYTCCKNRAYNVTRKKTNRQQPLSNVLDDLISDDKNPEKILIFNALYQDFQAAINTLPEKAKQVFLLKYLKKNRHKEIAKSMNISESMVEKHASNALRHLRKKLAIHALK